MSKSKTHLTRKVKNYLKAKELAKSSYDRADEILREIVKAANPGDVIPLDEGRSAILIDRFAEDDLIWAHAAARRYELKIISS